MDYDNICFRGASNEYPRHTVLWSNIIGLLHAKMYLRAYANSEDPNQPARQRSLIRAFFVRLQNHWSL